MHQYFQKMARPARKFARDRFLDPLIQSRTNLVPIDEYCAEDVFIVGYPKSGNTWFQMLAAGAIFGTNPLYAPGSLIKELVPDTHQERFYRRFASPMFFKSHLLPQPGYRRVVYLLRDGRDAMVSYFHYLTALRGSELDFEEMVRSEVGMFGKWHEHVEAWLSNPYGAEIIMIKYEDLKSDPVHELQRFCEFVDDHRDTKWLQEVVENAAFERMQQKEKAGRYGLTESRWPKDQMFNRRGIVGSYKDEMPPEVLAAFLQEAEEVLLRCGYL